MEQGWSTVPVGLYLVFGLLSGFYGCRLLKLTLVVLGGLLGLGLGLLVAVLLLGANPLALLILGLGGALIGAVLFGLVYKFAIFAAGMAAGTLAAPYLLRVLDVPLGGLVAWTIALLVGIVTGLLALLLERQLMVLVTATLGAVVMTVSALLLLKHHHRLAPDDVVATYHEACQRWWWVLVLLVALGAWWQLRGRGGKAKPEPREA